MDGWFGARRRSASAAPVAPGEAQTGAAKPPLSFNSDANNSGSEVVRIVSIRRGGKFDVEGGMAARLADLRKVEALAKVMTLPVFLTLTLERSGFASPEAGYDQAMPKVSELLRYLGVTMWARVAEVQTHSGDGWIHWHVLADVGATQFDLSVRMRRAWIDLSALQREVKRWWCERWKLGHHAGQDIQAVKKRGAIAGYLCKYITKPWPAIPPWVQLRKLVRTVGFSRAANEHFRQIGLAKERPTEDDQDNEDDATGGGRELGTIAERLASSGLECKVIAEGHDEGGKRRTKFLGRVACRLADVLLRKDDASGHGVEVGWVTRLYQSCYSVVHRCVFVLRDATARTVEHLNRWATAVGILDECRAVYAKRLNDLRNGWWIMQAEQFA